MLFSSVLEGSGRPPWHPRRQTAPDLCGVVAFELAISSVTEMARRYPSISTHNHLREWGQQGVPGAR